jgi:hypothetical protein
MKSLYSFSLFQKKLKRPLKWSKGFENVQEKGPSDPAVKRTPEVTEVFQKPNLSLQMFLNHKRRRIKRKRWTKTLSFE